MARIVRHGRPRVGDLVAASFYMDSNTKPAEVERSLRSYSRSFERRHHDIGIYQGGGYRQNSLADLRRHRYASDTLTIITAPQP